MSTANDLSTDECFEAIDKLASGGTEELDITGGEPLLRDDITELTEYATDQGLNVNITTNGTVGRERYADLAAHDVLFQVSIDGLRSVHESIRGSGTFDEVVQSMERLRDIEARFMVNTVVHSRNCDSLPELIEFLDGHGIHEIYFAFFAPTGRGEVNSSQFELTADELAKAKTDIKSACATHDIEYTIDEPDGSASILMFPGGTVVKQPKAGVARPLGDILEDDFRDTAAPSDT